MAIFRWQNEIAAIALILTACGVADAKVWPVAGSKFDLGYHIDEAERSGSLTSQQAQQLRLDEERIVKHQSELLQMHNNHLTPEDIATIENEVIKLRDRVNGVSLSKADNTRKNVGDGLKSAVVPEKQPNTKEELSKVIALRQTLMQDKGLSVNAKNIKIVANKDRLTLRGVVDSNSEKERIDTLARTCAGDSILDNQLQVAEK